MIRYYDTATQTETHKESATTIISTDDRVKAFFEPINPFTHRVRFENDLPIIEPIPQPTQAEIDARLIEEANQAEYQLLEELDKQSIRDIRELVASQPNAPQALKDREAQAVEVRGRIIK